MNNDIFIAVVCLTLGSIACHLYKQGIIKDLENERNIWKAHAQMNQHKLNTWKCKRPHLGEINNVQESTEKHLGFDLDDLLFSLDKDIEYIKKKFGVDRIEE